MSSVCAVNNATPSTRMSAGTGEDVALESGLAVNALSIRAYWSVG